MSTIGYVLSNGLQVSKTETIILCLTTLFFWGNSSAVEVLDLFLFFSLSPSSLKNYVNFFFKMCSSVIIFFFDFFLSPFASF